MHKVVIEIQTFSLRELPYLVDKDRIWGAASFALSFSEITS